MKVSTSRLSWSLDTASSLYWVYTWRQEVARGLLPAAPPYRQEPCPGEEAEKEAPSHSSTSTAWVSDVND